MKPKRRSPFLAIVCTLTCAAALVPASFGCADPVDPTLYTLTDAPKLEAFANQSVTVGTRTVLAGADGYLEKACGSLDCHGNEGRPLRIYSQRGLRKRGANNFTAAAATTDEEILYNYFSVIGLEPEIMSQVATSEPKGANPERLLFVRKPLAGEELTEPHKGGKIIGGTADDSYRCLVDWLGGVSNVDACAAAMIAIPP